MYPNYNNCSARQNTMNAFKSLVYAICDEYHDSEELNAKIEEYGGREKMVERLLNMNVYNLEDLNNYKRLNPLETLVDIMMYENI